MKRMDLTMDDRMSYNAQKYPAALAFQFENYTLTWAELNRITDSVAYGFLTMGIRKGTQVGIFSTNSPNWICTYIALAKIGAVSVLLNFNYKAQNLHEAAKYTSLEYLCYGDGYKDQDFNQMIDYLKEHRIWKIKKYIPIGQKNHGEWYQVSGFSDPDEKECEELLRYKSMVKSSDTLSMILTSGTIAAPKGVLLTQYQMLNIAREASEKMHWSQRDKICLPLALFHCFGLSTGLLASIVTGTSLCLLPSFRSKQVLEAVEKHKCTVINGVPSMFLAILENADFKKYNLSSLKSGIVAGSSIRKQDYYKITEEFGIKHLQQSYGQTEASPSITFSGYDDAMELKAISVGRTLEHMELRIMKRHGNKVLSPFKDGEIQIKGYNTMQYGYFKKKSETKRVFTADGWLRTGDLGHVDEAGNLFITGRVKEVIIRCGENIAPREIEEVMLDYNGVMDVKVFGIPAEITQEEIAACILPGKSFKEEGLRRYLKEKLPGYKIPKYIIEFEEFPLNTNGKINIKAMKETVLREIIKEEEE